MVRANEFLYFQLEAGVIEARIILDISNGHGRHAFELRLYFQLFKMRKHLSLAQGRDSKG